MNSLKSSHTQQSFRVHIEELVFHGFAPDNRYEVADAIQHELVRLLTERRESVEAISGRDAIDAGGFIVKQEARGSEIGTQLAQSIYRGLGNDAPPTTGNRQG